MVKKLRDNILNLNIFDIELETEKRRLELEIAN